MKSLISLLYEAKAESDTCYRQEAEDFLNNVVRYLKNKPNGGKVFKFSKILKSQYGYVAKADEFDILYNDLLLIFADVQDDMFSLGVGTFNGKEYNVLYLSIVEPNNMITDVNLYNDLKGHISEFRHEFIHYLDLKRTNWKNKGKNWQTSGMKLKTTGYANYVNTPEEFNAFYQEGVADLMTNRNPLRDDIYFNANSFEEFYKSVLIYFEPDFINNLNSVYIRKFQKRLYNLYKTYKQR